MPLVLKPRITVDFEQLMYALLQYEGLTVVPAVDVDSLNDIPLLTYAGFNGHMISNGDAAAGWEWNLALSLFAPFEDGGDIADTVYQIVHGWDDWSVPDAGIVLGVGEVSSVEDVSMFDRVGGATLPDKQLAQFNATFLVRVRPS